MKEGVDNSPAAFAYFIMIRVLLFCLKSGEEHFIATFLHLSMVGNKTNEIIEQ